MPYHAATYESAGLIASRSKDSATAKPRSVARMYGGFKRGRCHLPNGNYLEGTIQIASGVLGVLGVLGVVGAKGAEDAIAAGKAAKAAEEAKAAAKAAAAPTTGSGCPESASPAYGPSKPPGLRTPAEAGLTGGEAARIQNAADRIGKPVYLVGSRAEGTAKITSDWDYVVPEMTKRNKDAIKNSLPGAALRDDGIPRRIDLFRSNVGHDLPHVPFFPSLSSNAEL